ncbi:MAG: DUF6783 domain-containing protein [Ruminococcus sp.]
MHGRRISKILCHCFYYNLCHLRITSCGSGVIKICFHFLLFLFFSRACLKKAICKKYVTICGSFCPDKGVAAGCGSRIRVKYTAKWGVQIAEMIFQTDSGTSCRLLKYF